MAKRILIRRDTTSNWQAVNPILSNGELGIEIKADGTRKAKLGTGAIPWNSLDYFVGDFVDEEEFTDHVIDTSAHYSTDIPTANLIARYNADKGLKSDKIPVALNDVIRKNELDETNITVSTIESNLDTEIANRQSAVSGVQYEVDTLEDNLNNEIVNREAAVSGVQYEADTLEDNLNNEIVNREAAVSGVQYEADTLEDNLNNEISNRETAISGVQYEVNTLENNLNNEIVNRETAISGLQVSIDVLDLGLDTKISGLQYELNTEIANRGDAVTEAINEAAVDATNKAAAAENNAKEYADELSLSTQKWLTAVQTVADLPANPGEGTYLCRVITGDDYGVYQWIGTDPNPSWNYFSDNLDFIDRVSNPIAGDIPIIDVGGELEDSGVSLSGLIQDVDNKEATIISGLDTQYWRGDKTWQTLSKNDVGLENVDNTADIDKPISDAVSGALFEKADNTDLEAEIINRENAISGITYDISTKEDEIVSGDISQYWRGDKTWQTLDKTAVGLSSVDNTADIDKPISEAVSGALEEREPAKYIAADEADAQNYSNANSGILTFYPEP